MEPILLVFLIILLACATYYVVLKITSDTTFAFIAGVVILLVGFFGRGLLG